jgi:hypothetical protein
VLRQCTEQHAATNIVYVPSVLATIVTAQVINPIIAQIYHVRELGSADTRVRLEK